MKYRRLYSYQRSHVINLQLVEYDNEKISPEKIDLKDMKFQTYRNYFIGENLIHYIYFDIDQAINDPERIFNEEMVELKSHDDIEPFFFWSFAHRLFDENHQIDELQLKKFKMLQKKYKKLLLDILNNRLAGKSYKESDAMEAELSRIILHEKERVWFEFEDLESALECEIKALRMSPSCVFKCEQCGRLGVGTDRASCCSNLVKINLQERTFEETFQGDEKSILHSYIEARYYTCKNAFRDIRAKELRNTEGEMQNVYKQSLDRIKQQKKRKQLEYHPNQKDIRNRLKELAEIYQEFYDAAADEDERNDIIEDYKKAFEILIMPPDENGNYMSWDEWEQIYNN